MLPRIILIYVCSQWEIAYWNQRKVKQFRIYVSSEKQLNYNTIQICDSQFLLFGLKKIIWDCVQYNLIAR